MDIKEIISKDKSIVIVPYDKASDDVLASAIATYLALQENGYQVDILYSGETNENLKSIASDIKIHNIAPDKQLVISVDYQDKTIEEVDYSIEDNKLNLILKPISNKFDVSHITYHIKGGAYDTAILFGCWNKDKSEIITNNSSTFINTSFINIDISHNNEKTGDINIIDTELDTMAELTLQTLVKWGLKIPKTSAKLLLNSINS